MDEALFHWINGWTDGLNPLFFFLSEGNKLLPVRLGFLAVFVCFFLKGGKWRAAILIAVAAWLISNELCDILKNGSQWLRPCVALPESEVVLRVKKLTSFGTASAHSASMAAVAFVFTSYLGKWGWPWIAVAMLVGISRIYVGVHYPSQVVLGWFVGCVIAFICIQTFKAFQRIEARRGKPKQDSKSIASNPNP